MELKILDLQIHNTQDLFKLAEKHIVNIYGELNQKITIFYLNLFDKAEIINTEEF